MRQYKWAVFIGRFAPFHKGHLNTLEHGLNIADRVLVLLGSSCQSRDTKNPLTWEERATIIDMSLTPEQREQVSYAPLMDFPYSEPRWSSEVQRLVWESTQNEGVVLIGYEKDDSSYYLNEFPMWDYMPVQSTLDISSTTLRENYYTAMTVSTAPKVLLDDIKSKMATQDAYDFFITHITDDVLDMWKYEESYEMRYGLGPFICVDASVIQSGHLLLVSRKHYGKGQLALPGGFLNRDETCLDGAIRELREETGLKVPPEILRGSIKKNRLFDSPTRSRRARIVTYVYAFELNDGKPLPKVRGRDDAEKAMWVPLSAITRERMFEDHYHIIRELHGLT